jgi:hypothetical protein
MVFAHEIHVILISVLAIKSLFKINSKILNMNFITIVLYTLYSISIGVSYELYWLSHEGCVKLDLFLIFGSKLCCSFYVDLLRWCFKKHSK